MIKEVVTMHFSNYVNPILICHVGSQHNHSIQEPLGNIKCNIPCSRGEYLHRQFVTIRSIDKISFPSRYIELTIWINNGHTHRSAGDRNTTSVQIELNFSSMIS